MKNHNSKFFSVLTSAVCASALVLALATPSQAANGADTWSTTGTGTTFNTAGDWTGTNKPPISGDSLVFGAPGTGGLTLTDDLTSGTAFSITGITFNSGDGAYIINAGAGKGSFTLNGGITNNGTSVETINDAIALGNNETITVGSTAGGVTLGGVLSGAHNLTTAGKGTLTLNGVDTYSGSTTIATGTTLAVGSTGKLGNGSYAGAIADTGALSFGGSSSQTLSGVISSTGTLTDSGTGTLTLTGKNTYTGATTINSGSALTMSGGSGAFSGGIADGGTFTYSSSAADTITGVWSGAGSFVDSGTGILTVTGASSFSGNTTINSGSEIIVGAEYMGQATSASIFTINGTLDFASNHTSGQAETFGGTGSFIDQSTGLAYFNFITGGSFSGTTTLAGASTANGVEFTGIGSLPNSAVIFTGDTLLEDNSGTANSTAAIASVTITPGVVATLANVGAGTTTFSLGAINRTSNSGMLDISSLSGAITTTTANTNGILGTWAFTGSGLGLSYVTDSGSTPYSIGIYGAATADADGSLSVATDPTANYSTAFSTVANTSAVTGNTLQFIAASPVTWTNTGGATLNGLMDSLGSGGSLTESGATITIGAQQELDILTSGSNITLGSVIADNATGASSLEFDSVGPATFLGTASTSGSDTLTLSGVNTYTGGTYILGGSLTIAGAGQLGSGNYAGAILDNGTALNYNSSADQIFSGVLSGSGSLSVGGTGLLSLDNANDTASSLIFTGANSTVGGTGTLTLNNSTAGNTGGFIQVNAGDVGNIATGLTIATTNTGNYYINGGGTLNLYGGMAITNTVNVDDATFNIYGTFTAPYLETGQGALTTVGSNNFINIDGGTVTLSDALILANQTQTLTTTSGGAPTASGYSALTLNSGTISTGVGGKGYVDILPGGNAGNSYLYLDGGTLTASFFNQVAAGTVVGQSALYFNGGTLAMNENFTTSGTITSFLSNIGSSTASANFVGANGLIGPGGVYVGGTNGVGGATIDVNGFTNSISQAFLSGNGVAGSSASGNTGGQTDGGVVYTGGGTLTLTGASAGSTYNGGTTIDGTLSTAAYHNGSAFSNTTVISSVAGDLGATTGSLLIDNAGILDLDQVSQQVGAITFGAASTTTGSEVTSTGGTATLTGTTADVYGTGNVIDTPVTVAANTTVDNGGALALNGQVTGTMAVASGGTLTGTGTVNGNATLTGAGIIDFGSTGDITGTLGVTGGNWNGLGSVGGLVTSSSGNFNLGSGATLTAASGVSVTGGTISTTNATGTIAGSLSYSSSASSAFAGVIVDGTSPSALTVSAGTLDLSGDNTFSGGTTITGGVLALSGMDGTTLASTGSVTLNGAGILDLEGTTQNIGALNGTGGTIENLETLANTNSDLIVGNGNASGSYAGTIMDGVNGDSYTTLTKVGTGTQVLSGSNQYSFGTVIDGGVLQVASENNLGNSGGYFASVGGTNGITLGGGELQTTSTTGIVESVALTSGTTNTLAASSGTTATYSGVVSDVSSTGGLTIGDGTNNGTVILTAANTYTGPTTVVAKAGLGVTGSLNPTTSLSVGAGASFALGHAAGGSSFLSQTVSTLSLASTGGVGSGNEAVLAFSLGAGNDMLTSTGAFTLTGSSFNLDLTSVGAISGTYDLVEWAAAGSTALTLDNVDLTYDGASLGLDSSDLSIVTSGGNDILQFNAAAAPEPGIGGMMLLGLGLLVSFQAYRKRQAQV